MQQFHGSDEYIASDELIRKLDGGGAQKAALNQGRTGHWKDDARGGDCQIPRYGTFDLEY